MKQLALVAKKRCLTGSGDARRRRKEGWIPGIIYGDSGSLPILFGAKDLRVALKQMSGSAAIVSIAIDGYESRSAILAEFQKNPLTDEILHVDFHEVSLTKKMLVHIPIRLTGVNECIGAREEGGVFECVTHTLSIRCVARDMPSEYVVDVSGLRLGQTIHIKDLEKLDRVEFVDPADQVIAACIEATEEDAGKEEGEEASEKDESIEATAGAAPGKTFDK
ncbi:MAG: 50S ribosomal protein L25 [Puniceicoccales bacterium]|jgi:large subunit ribosomal protein L25|nr:50S ribosomal protein L25 [Puniceicoccales bacterium]